MFVVTLNKTSLKKVGAGALCCALVIFSAFLGRYISTRTVAAAAGVNRIESAQDIQTWFTGYGLDVDGTSITADKVKIPRKWDDSFSAFNGVVQQSGMDLTRYKGKTVEKWTALIPAASSGETSRYGVLLVYRKKAVGAYLLEKPSGTVIGLKDAQTAMAQAEQQDAQQVSGEDYSGDVNSYLFGSSQSGWYVNTFANNFGLANFVAEDAADLETYEDYKDCVGSADHIFDYVELDEEHAIFEVAVPEGWAEKTIGQLNVRRKYNINIMALKHDGKMKLNISPDTVLPAEDTMLVLGNIRDIQRCFHI